MKVKLETVLNSIQALRKIAAEPLPVKYGYRISKILKAVENEMQIFDNLRIALVQRLGEEKEGGEYVVKPENQDEFTKELTELLNQEIELNCEKIQLDWIGDVKLTYSEALTLEYLLEGYEQ